MKPPSIATRQTPRDQTSAAYESRSPSRARARAQPRVRCSRSRAADIEELLVGPRAVRVEAVGVAQPKVDELDSVVGEEDVLDLEVPVHDAARMAVRQAGGDPAKDLARSLLGQRVPVRPLKLGEKRIQVSSPDALEHQAVRASQRGCRIAPRGAQERLALRQREERAAQSRSPRMLVLCVRDGEITLTANSEAAPRALRRPANTWPHAPSPRRREEQRKRRAEGTLFKSLPG
mmetsp:Transcript_8009/g.26225  ORF Transcript_8009/g.26225 Transcript_8009/m.26225 type:complete len:233 (-) Transcript_8009:11-709(-)